MTEQIIDNTEDPKPLISPEPEAKDTDENDREAADTTDRDGELESLDYGQVARRDLEELKSLFPALLGLTSITQLDDPLRYAALRDLGLSPKEAYLATGGISIPAYDNRGHLSSAVPKMAAASKDEMSASQLSDARMIFHDLSDREIQRLYKKVTAK